MISRLLQLIAFVGAALALLFAGRGKRQNPSARNELQPDDPLNSATGAGSRGTSVSPPPANSKEWWVILGKHFAWFALLLVVAGFLVAASGIIPVKASSDHWPITRWFLNFAMRRSVVTHSLGLKPPSLTEPGLIAKGAAHYEAGCRPCHGSPGRPPPAIPHQMTPHPPDLQTVVPDWDDDELFYIVKHGVKFTGMPAWPAQQRDDEVWAIIAFLRQLPELNREEYEKLALGGSSSSDVGPLEELVPPQAAPLAVAESCARCHGRDGLGRGLGVFPILAGQKPDYLFESLQAYARGDRHSGIMGPVANGLSDEAMRELANYYASRPPRIGQAKGPPSRSAVAGGRMHPGSNPKSEFQNPKLLEAGRIIAERGIPEQDVPACVECHGPSPLRRNRVYPLLNGQYADYLELQLTLFKHKHRGGTEYAHLMHHVAGGLKPEQARAVALYYASLARRPD